MKKSKEFYDSEYLLWNNVDNHQYFMNKQV